MCLESSIDTEKQPAVFYRSFFGQIWKQHLILIFVCESSFVILFTKFPENEVLVTSNIHIFFKEIDDKLE